MSYISERLRQQVIESARETPAFRHGEGERLVLSGRYSRQSAFPEGRERFELPLARSEPFPFSRIVFTSTKL